MAGAEATYAGRAGELVPPPGAAVVPRVRLTPGGAAQSLEAVIRRLIDRHAHGPVLLTARPGGGKTTALSHLAAVLPPHCRVALLDEPPFVEIPAFHDSLGLV